MTDKIGALVEQLNERLPRNKLLEYAGRFSYKRGDLDPNWSTNSQTHGFLTRCQVAEIVDWKTDGRQRLLFCEENTDAAVQMVTKFAFEAAQQFHATPDIAASILCAVPHIQIPTASTILTAWRSDLYGIIDTNCWNVLHDLVPRDFNAKKAPYFTTREFRFYTLVLRSWARSSRLNPRDIDKALWQYDQEKKGRHRQVEQVKAKGCDDCE